MSIVFVGIDLAKNVFAVHAVNDAGKPELVRPNVPRAKLHALIANLPPCTIGMEACSGAHHWARLFQAHGHTVRLMAPKFVAPYRLSGKQGKNDAADAAAICEAVQRPSMRFVPVKSIEQQGQLMVHRARQAFVEARTGTINRIRGLLSEVGIVLPLKAQTVRTQAAAALEDLPGWANTVIGDLLSELHRLDERIAAYDRPLSRDGRFVVSRLDRYEARRVTLRKDPVAVRATRTHSLWYALAGRALCTARQIRTDWCGLGYGRSPAPNQVTAGFHARPALQEPRGREAKDRCPSRP